MGYDAFISYSHDADLGLSARLADGLGRLAKPWWRRRALSVFCDTSALSANPALWTSIQESMAESTYLVVLASPDAAQSPWVGREIEHWRATKGAGTILLALTAGELVWDDAQGDFDAARSTALHPAMQGAFSDEPLWVDLRWASDDEVLTLRNPRFLDAVAVLAAPIHGTAKNELVGEDLRQHRRTLRIAWSAALMVALLAIAAIVGAFIARDKADEAQQKAAEVIAANKSATRAKHETAVEKSKTKAAKAARARANADADDAKKQRKQAERQAAAAEFAANASAVVADQKTAEAVMAAQQAELQRQLAQTAQSEAASAQEQQQAAEAAQDKAEKSRAAAEAAMAKADEDRRQAVLEKTQAEAAEQTANANARQANLDAAAAGALAQATTLAAASQDPDLVAGGFDTALLLANAATQVQAENVSATAVDAPTPSEPAAVARDALLKLTQQAGSGFRNHLQFSKRAGPLVLGTTAISRHGGKVAAAELTAEVRLGERPGRLFVWRSGLDPADRAIDLSASLAAGDSMGCVSGLFWADGGNVLVSVEDPFVSIDDPHGCLTPLEDPVLGFPFVSRTVRIWIPGNPGDQVQMVKFTDTRSQNVTSPVSVSPDGTLVAVQLRTGTFVIDTAAQTPQDQARFIPAFVTQSTLVAGDNWTPDSTYLVGYLPSGTPPPGLVSALWSHDAKSTVTIPSGAVTRVHVDPAVTTVGVTSGTFLHLFDPATGAEVGPPNDLLAPVCSVGLGPDGLGIALIDPAGQCRSTGFLIGFDWHDPSADFRWVVPVDVDGGQLAEVGLSPAGRWATETYFTPQPNAPTDPPGQEHTLVVDAATGAERGDLTGSVVQFGQPDESFAAVQELAVTPDTVTVRAAVWDLRSAPVPVLARDNSEAVAAPDGKSVVVLPTTKPVAPGPAEPVTIWPLDAGEISAGARDLPGPSGAIGSVAFDDDGLLVGFGQITAGLVWDPARRPYETLDVVAPTATHAPCSAFGDPEVPALETATSPRDGSITRAITEDGVSVFLRSIDPAHHSHTDVPAGLVLEPGEVVDYMLFTRDGGALIVNLCKPSAAPTPANPNRFSRSIVVRLDSNTNPPTPGAPVDFDEEAITSSTDGSRIAFLSLNPSLTPRRSRVIVRDTADLDATPWTINTGALGEDDEEHGENLYTLDLHGNRLAGTNATARYVVWDRDEGSAPIRVCSPGSQGAAVVNLYGASFNRNGSLAVKSADEALRLVDPDQDCDTTIATARLPADVSRQIASRLRFSDDGKLLLVDGIYLFDATTLDRIGPRLHPVVWRDLTDFGTGATFFTHDGNYVMAERSDKTELVRWAIGLESTRAQACSSAGRNLTDAEAKLFEVENPNEVCPGFPPDGQ